MLNFLFVFVVGYVVVCLLVMWREPHMIYYPIRPLDGTPDQLGWKFDDVFLTTSDGVRIHGWFLPNGGKNTVLFLHGNAGNLSHRFEKLEILRALGVDVLIIDYRGYGRSEATPNELGTYTDAQAAYEFLTGQLKRAPRTIIVYGESLGAAVGVDLASRVPTGGVIIEAAFTSVGDVGQGLFPYLPVRWLVRNKYDTLEKIDRIAAPLLILHSREDEMIPFRHAERLYAAARDPKQLVALRGSHNDSFTISSNAYRNALKSFVERS